jgi:hypothetical protein
MKAEIGKTYVHYKNKNVYTVVAIGRLERNPDERYVVYRAGYVSDDHGDNATWIRPQAEFEEEVTVDGKTFPRFTRVDS